MYTSDTENTQKTKRKVKKVKDMKELRNNFDKEVAFEDLQKAKNYYMPDTEEFPEEVEYAQEIEDAETLEELAHVLTKYTDMFDNGSQYFVHEF